jgi:hypothetical protein
LHPTKTPWCGSPLAYHYNHPTITFSHNLPLTTTQRRPIRKVSPGFLNELVRACATRDPNNPVSTDKLVTFPVGYPVYLGALDDSRRPGATGDADAQPHEQQQQRDAFAIKAASESSADRGTDSPRDTSLFATATSMPPRGVVEGSQRCGDTCTSRASRPSCAPSIVGR